MKECREFINPHLQYCRSTDPAASHDLMMQMNHGAYASGRLVDPPSELGADAHVVHDDGSN